MPLRIVSLLVIAMMLNACDRPSEPSLVQPLDDAVSDILSSFPEATIGVAVVDPATGTRYSINGDTTFHAASTMKTPVMIEVFRQAEEGRFSVDDSLLVENRFRSIVDGTEYSIGTDSDDGIYDALGRSMSIRSLTHNMITISSNLATNLLIDLVTASAVQETVERLGGSGISVLRGVEDLKAFDQGMNNTVTADGLAALYVALMEGRAVSPDADGQMVGILLDQQFTRAIPRNLPEGVAVAHKTGSITGINHDGGIVYPEGREPYVLVVLTRGFATSDEATEAMSELASEVHAVLRPD